MKREFFRFVLVGVANTLVGLLVIFGMKAAFQAGDVLANAIGYLVGLSMGFVLNRTWTFRHQGSVAADAARFVAAFLIAYAINLGVVVALIDGFAVNSFVAQALGVPPYTVTFFLISKFYVFRRLEAGSRTR
jgi:putative flippase GtrA